jgi:hypothetical protein
MRNRKYSIIAVCCIVLIAIIILLLIHGCVLNQYSVIKEGNTVDMNSPLDSTTPIVSTIDTGSSPNVSITNTIPLTNTSSSMTQKSIYSSLVSPEPKLSVSSSGKYSADNYSVLYHESAKDITDRAQAEGTTGTWIIDSSGKKKYYTFNQMDDQPITYYTPGEYTYGASNYIPTYEDSVYLSKTTNQSTLYPVSDITAITRGFCAQNADDSGKVEMNCKALDSNTCASTSCCVLLGGAKCVSGNERGPTYIDNYNDPTLVNRDTYTFNGECYGNCDKKI